jgi:TRAP-type C4-dicarboxylate transport system substrate-binding protein
MTRAGITIAAAISAAIGIALIPGTALAQASEPELPPLAKMRDANNNNRIERSEAAGPLAPSFDEIDCDRSGNLDGKEILGFFQGEECKTPVKSADTGQPKAPAAQTRAANELLFNLYLPRTTAMFTNVVGPWATAMASSTEGRIEIKFTASSLAPVNRQLRMVAKGVADAGMGIHHFTRRRTVTARVSELPFAARTSRAASIAAWQTVQKFGKASEYKGVKLVGVVSPPPTLIFNSKKPIKSLKDFRSLKILAAGSLVQPAKLLGAPVVTIPLPFAYEQFSRGVVDGTFSNFGGIMGFRLAKFIKFATPVPGGVGNTSIFLVINQKKFDGLGKPDRDAIMAVSGEAFGAYAAGWDTNEKDAVRQAREAGIQTTPLPPAALAELKKRWSVIEPQWIADAGKLGIDGKAAVAFYRGALAKLHGGR